MKRRSMAVVITALMAIAVFVGGAFAHTISAADYYVSGASVWQESNGLDGLQKTETILPGDDGELGTEDDVTIAADSRVA